MGKYNFKLDLYDDSIIAWIAGRITENANVLEFGPANGRLTKYLAEHKNCRVDIVEIEEQSGKEAAQYAVHAFIGKERGDIEKYFWLETEQKYDYIVFADVLEHLVHPQDVLERCKAILQENGKLLVSIPNISHNSIIIDLINDRFQYNSTGIMDNTHVRFFTRQSFGQMALQAGWTIVEEKAKNIRVGETEIKNAYTDVSKEMAKELMARPQGSVYQYLFVLALNNSYVQGSCEQIISLDSTSYYKMEIQYEHDGIFDYARSVSRQVNPYYGYIRQRMTVLDNEGSALIKLLNCNCVVEIRTIKVFTEDSVKIIDRYKHNGYEIGAIKYFIDDNPEIEVELFTKGMESEKEKIKEIEIECLIYKYDFEDKAWSDIYMALRHEQKHIEQICSDYETVVREKDQQIKTYETAIQEQNLLIQKKENELQELKKYLENAESFLTCRQKKQMMKHNMKS